MKVIASFTTAEQAQWFSAMLYLDDVNSTNRDKSDEAFLVDKNDWLLNNAERTWTEYLQNKYGLPGTVEGTL